MSDRKEKDDEDFDILNVAGLESEEERVFRKLANGAELHRPKTWADMGWLVTPKKGEDPAH